MKIEDLIDYKSKTYKWDVIEAIPEFARLKECQQSPKWRSEGTAWVHTKKVCDAMISLLDEQRFKSQFRDSVLMTATLFHDIGKGVVTSQGKDGRWHSFGHELESERIARYLLWNEKAEIRETVCALVRWHMEPLAFLDKKNYLERIAEVSSEVGGMWYLWALKTCDVLGSIPEDKTYTKKSLDELNYVLEIAQSMGCDGTKADDCLLRKNLPDAHRRKPISVTVLIGLPGSGKSTYASKIADENTVIISRDAIREELGLCGKGEKIVASSADEEKVTELFNKRLLYAAKNGKRIVIDNINLRKKYRDGYKTTMSAYNVIWDYVYVEAPSLETNILRRSGQIPEDVFKKMILNFDWPRSCEYSTLTYKYE